jgi:hypothetical protein
MIDLYGVSLWHILALGGLAVAAALIYGEVRAALARHSAPLDLRRDLAEAQGCIRWQAARHEDDERVSADLKDRLRLAAGGAHVTATALHAPSAAERAIIEEATR